MSVTRMMLIVLLLLTLSGQALAAPPVRRAEMQHCLVSLIEEVQVPAHEAGPLTAVPVTDGAAVQRGGLLAQIDDRQAQIQRMAAELERDAALARAEDEIEIRYAQASYEVADAELAQNLEINRRTPNGIPATEIRRLQLTKHRAQLQIEKSRLDLKVAKMTADVQQATVAAADEMIARRRIVSPVDGVVVATYRQLGEWVNAGEPVVHVARMDRLRVEGFVSGAEFNADELDGRPVTVDVELARGRVVQFSGRVVFVSPLVQAGNKYRVRAEVDNRQENGHWLLRPGATAVMAVHLR